jgi:peptidoglycan/LPS O-acetylase OafA/YrhL
MEGLRGLAVFLVFLVHYITLSEPWISKSEALYPRASLVRSLGNVGVDLFFVLSGYLIYGLLMKKDRPFIPYFRRRIERIYPTFATVFALYVILSFIFPAKSKIPRHTADAAKYLAENFLLLPGMFDIEPMITVAWSLSYEFFFYLCVPFLIFALRLRRWRPMSRVVFFLLLAAFILAVPQSVGGHARLVMFISGILVFEASTYGRPPAQLDVLGLLGLVLGLVGAVALSTYGLGGQWKFGVLAASFFLLCWACFSMDGRASRAFRWTPMRWLGNMSYSYYLIHGLVLNSIFLVLPRYFAPTGDNLAVFWLGLPLCFLATFVVSTALFLWIEKPYSLNV